ncbi:MAG: class F sortase [Hamadaea sp.]|uniref:class F sortase n=1 Tax=Hamadaea sp. TaxID=2024425 RepID=UPI0017B757FB|nr:class F sortase [Hamadaea sp.]NUR71899.1 class F sortase [Hamadaea sp.]NUT17959.1 class F sortase [Hamadaea sp.]
MTLRTGRWTGWLAGLLVLAGIFCAGVGLGQATGAFSLPHLFGSGTKAPPGKFPVLGPSRPMRIVIPSIGVRATVHGVGRDRDGAIAVPALSLTNEAGWFTEGPSPGQYGPAILVGHVDTHDHPAVFHKLDDLKAGARIEITRRDRNVTVFEVNSVETFRKSDLPAKRVYDDYSRPALRLITCGGSWVGGDLGYASNVIVFASLIEVHKA